MQKVLTAAEMREVDRLTTERYGIPSIILMENAAHAVARVITEKLGGSVKGKSILILCGRGNNGGDGAALARVLAFQGANVYAVLNGERKRANGDALVDFEAAAKLNNSSELGLAWIETEDIVTFGNEVTNYLDATPELDLVVDALFGSGLDRPLDDALTACLELIWTFLGYRELFPPVVSIDVPSGLSPDKAEPIGHNIRSNFTVSFTAPKPSNVLPPSYRDNGELFVEPIGTPDELVAEQPSKLFVAEKTDAELWTLRSSFHDASYKNKRGHALIFAGSENYSGAAVLAGNAAMRSGVGLVSVVTPGSSKESIAARVLPEVMVRGVAETASGAVAVGAFDEIGDLLEKADAVAVGCGLSQDESTREFVKKLVENRRGPMIVDADALNLLSPFSTWSPPAYAGGSDGASVARLILTPHEGEFLRLLGTDDKESIKDRVAAVREFSQKNNVILVLKGERVLIGEPGGKVVVNPTGNSGLGKAGNGDTLTGVLAGFCAQAAAMDIDIFETVVAAVYLSGLAGDIAEKKYGKRVMTASDVRECLSEAFREVGLGFFSG